jgi:hypothetical protein
MTQLLLSGTSLSASASSSLDEALKLVEARLNDWASSRNSDAYDALLLQIFGLQKSGAIDAQRDGIARPELVTPLQESDVCELARGG